MKRFVIVMLMLTVVVSGMRGQSSSQNGGKSVEKSRKRVAVVLSGGGAKGMGHIGVLKVIERAGIPVDIVTGTSMGSIVGGLYALGYNAQLLDSVVRHQDWTTMFTDKEDMSYQMLAARKKQYTYALSTGMSFGRSGLKSGGIIRGTNIMDLFYKLCEGYTDSLDFSRDLPIPFACVATNIVNNTEEVFHSGRLPRAMRASMAIPAVFSPVRMGDKVLVDGGLLNNYPADVAREMGADIIIGVSVQSPPKTADSLSTTRDVLGQIIDFNCKRKYEENLAITDLPMQVDVTGYSAASFSVAAIDTLIRRGEEEAMRHWDELMALKKRIGIGDDYQPPHRSYQRSTLKQEKYRVTRYEFENMTHQDERFLRGKFSMKPGDSLDVDREQLITTSMRVDLFYQTAECRRIPDGDGMRVVFIAGKRKKMQAYVGFRFDSEEYAAVQVAADIPIANTMPVNADVLLRLGKRIKATGELTLHSMNLYQSRMACSFMRNDLDIFTNGNRDYSILYHQYQTELVPFSFNLKNFNIDIGTRWDYINYRDKLVSPRTENLDFSNQHYFSYRAILNYSSEDNWLFPTRGSRFKAQYVYLTDDMAKLGGKPGMSDLSAHWRTSLRLGGNLTFQPMLYGRLLFGANVPLPFSNAIGGQWFGHIVEQQMPFSGMGNMELTDRHFIAMRLQAQQRIGSKQYVVMSVSSARHADSLKDLFKHEPLVGGQIGYNYNTMIGPVGATLGYNNESKEVYLYFNLGFEF